MRAFVMTELGVGGIASTADPVPAEGEALLAPIYSGLCGTDVHLFTDGTMLEESSLPLVLGHETVASVIEPNGLRSSDGSALAVDDVVVAEPVLPCGTCLQCSRGRPNLCAAWTHLGITHNGSWADLVAVQASRLTRVPDGVSARDAALAEPLACAVNFVLDRGALAVGESVLVLGAGPVGLLVAAVARAAGASAVIVSEPQASRRARALSVGADAVIDPVTEDLADAIATLTQGRGVDLIVEVSGAPRAISQAIAVAARGSRVVLAGLGSGASVTLDTNDIVLKELDVRGGFASRWAMSRGLSLLARGAIHTASIITSERSWADAVTAMSDMANDTATCKILLSAPDPDSDHPDLFKHP